MSKSARRVTVTRNAMMTRLNVQVWEAGSLRALARKLGLSAAYLSDVRLGKREFGVKLCRALGAERRVVIQRIVTFTRKLRHA